MWIMGGGTIGKGRRDNSQSCITAFVPSIVTSCFDVLNCLFLYFLITVAPCLSHLQAMGKQPEASDLLPLLEMMRNEVLYQVRECTTSPEGDPHPRPSQMSDLPLPPCPP